MHHSPVLPKVSSPGKHQEIVPQGMLPGRMFRARGDRGRAEPLSTGGAISQSFHRDRYCWQRCSAQQSCPAAGRCLPNSFNRGELVVIGPAICLKIPFHLTRSELARLRKHDLLSPRQPLNRPVTPGYGGWKVLHQAQRHELADGLLNRKSVFPSSRSSPLHSGKAGTADLR